MRVWTWTKRKLAHNGNKSWPPGIPLNTGFTVSQHSEMFQNVLEEDKAQHVNWYQHRDLYAETSAKTEEL
jgi:hypothetical protein